MIRDLNNIERSLDDPSNIDILMKKRSLMQIFLSDPDLQEVLGKLEPKYNPYEDPVTHRAKEGLTDEELKEYQEIADYNEAVSHEQIVDYLKLNDLQKEVLNFIMYDMYDERMDYDNRGFKRQYVIVMVVVNDGDLTTEFGSELFNESKNPDERKSLGMYMFKRADVLAYIIKDLLNWSNVLGAELQCYSDEPKILDSGYYCREIRFITTPPNTLKGHGGLRNAYDPNI